MDRKLDAAMGQLQICVAGIDQLKSRFGEGAVVPRGQGFSHHQDRMSSVGEAGEDGECRKGGGDWLPGVCTDLPSSDKWGERFSDDAELADELAGPSLSALPELADEGSAVDFKLSQGDSRCSSAMNSIDDFTPQRRMKGAASLRMFSRTGTLAEKAWNIMEEGDDLGRGVWWGRMWVWFLISSVAFTLTQTLESPPLSAVGAAVVETAIDFAFGLELVVRFALSPNTRAFVTSPLNLVDFLSVLPIVLRAHVGFTLPRHLDSFGVPALLLVCIVPMLRLAKALRWTGVQMKLFERVLGSTMETLQFLALCGCLIILNFAFWIFLVEPRDSIDTYWRAIWLTIVTMTTVGYGDVSPETTEGHVVISILIVCSVLFMAIPIGVLGNAFAFVWGERDLILLIEQTRRRLNQWGHSPEDLPKFILRFDVDGDGALSFDEFSQMMTALNVTLSVDRMVELFQMFDRDHGGSIDANEFLREVFPKTFHERLRREREKKDKEMTQRRLQNKKSRQEERFRSRIDQGRGTLAAAGAAQALRPSLANEPFPPLDSPPSQPDGSDGPGSSNYFVGARSKPEASADGGPGAEAPGARARTPPGGAPEAEVGAGDAELAVPTGPPGGALAPEGGEDAELVVPVGAAGDGQAPALEERRRLAEAAASGGGLRGSGGGAQERTAGKTAGKEEDEEAALS